MKLIRRPLSVAVLSALALTACGSGTGEPTTTSAIAAPVTKGIDPVKDRYIVVLKSNDVDVDQLMNGLGGRVIHKYNRVLKGFAAQIPEQAVNGVLKNPQVAYVERDAVVSVDQTLTTQTVDALLWGLDRIDQPYLPLSKSYSYADAGAGVTAYIIDTGILASHQEFYASATNATSRVKAGFTSISDTNGTNDCNGHGTHVAGTVGGLKTGVAKSVSLVPVRVLDCTGTGTWADVIAGLEWVAQNPRLPAVVNLSLGGSALQAVDTAVANTVARGITVVAAAGNSNVDACTSSPAREPSAITVAASTLQDSKAAYSNFGPCVDLFAPGSTIWSASKSAYNTYASMSGTSMAAPHVTGAAVLILSQNPQAAPVDVTAALQSRSVANVLTGLNANTPNLLLQTRTGPSSPTRVLVAGLTSSSAIAGAAWYAQVTIAVQNDFAQPVAGAVVTGKFSTDKTALKCATNNQGVCIMQSAKLTAKVTSSLFSVSNIAATSLVYDPGLNVATTTTVAR